MDEKICIIADDNRLVQFLCDSLTSLELVEKSENGLEEETDNQYQFIFLECNYACSLKQCINKFLFLMRNSKTPFGIVRNILDRTDKFNEHFVIYFNRQFSLSSVQENIIRRIRNSKGYACSPGCNVHPSNLVFKIALIQKEIIENCPNLYGAKSLATFARIHPCWLSTKFKQITGITLKSFLIRIKLCYSLWRIISSELQIKYIASEAGYKDHRSFSKTFGSLFGIAPSLIRKKLEFLS